MHKNLWIISFIIWPAAGISQQHGSFEQYYYTGLGTSVIVPKMQFQNKNNWFGEVRYNYEELQTISFNAGKIFSKSNSFSYTVSPYAGLVLGRLNGGTVGSNISVEHSKLFFSAESQYTFSMNEKSANYFFNWSELGYQFTKLMYSGIAVQVTHPFEVRNNWEPGIMLGITYKSWTFPFYTFSPANNNRNYVLGISWEWDYKNQKTSNHNLLTILE